MTSYLDARPARQLTSREYAKLLGALLGAMRYSNALGLDQASLRASLVAAQSLLTSGRADTSDMTQAAAVALLYGTLVGWIDMGKREAVLAAVRFYLETDALGSLEQLGGGSA